MTVISNKAKEEREEPKMKKKIILLCVAAAMTAVLAVGGTLAYLTAESEHADNTFAIGEVSGKIIEKSEGSIDWDKEGGNTATNIIPGEAVLKAPKVELGDESRNAYVRLTVTGVDFSENGNGIGDFTAVMGNDWTYYDGKYYYNNILSNPENGDNDITSPLFTEVILKTGFVTGTPNPIAVSAELIQAEYLGAVTSEDVPSGFPLSNAAVSAFFWFDNAPDEPTPYTDPT
jgi:predicted ribosomally synthesized peptide with SipW-like signal peptide